MNVVGLDDAALGMVPAQQRLDAEHACRFEVEDRLVHEEVLAAFDRWRRSSSSVSRSSTAVCISRWNVT